MDGPDQQGSGRLAISDAEGGRGDSFPDSKNMTSAILVTARETVILGGPAW
jgi:hypothetical protein